MSDRSKARRTVIGVFFSGVDITSSLEKYLISLTYTDNDEDAADDLQIKLQDRSGIWREKWLNTAIQAAASTPSESGDTENGGNAGVPYTVSAESGLAVRSRAGEQYYQYGTLSYGDNISVNSIENGWANITYNGKNAYVSADYIQEGVSSVDSADESKTDTTSGGEPSADWEACKAMRIHANIARLNWRTDGKDDVLECGQFELDNVTLQGPPNTITIKATSLPYNATIRQTLRSKSWECYYLSGIAGEIAGKSGMGCMFLAESDPFYDRVEQYKSSDITFLKKLCNDKGLSLKASNNVIIIFDQATYEQKSPIRKIPYGQTGGYTKYSLATSENDNYALCRVSYTTNSGELITATEKAENYDPKNNSNQCLEIRQKVGTVDEAKALARKYLRLYNKFGYEGTFTFPGDPTLCAGSTVELEGWGAFDGKYLIKQAKHSISKSGYTTQIKIQRSLTADAGGESNTDDNKLSQEEIDNIAKAVIRGEWSNGEERQKLLAEAGYDYATIQNRVNEMIYG